MAEDEDGNVKVSLCTVLRSNVTILYVGRKGVVCMAVCTEEKGWSLGEFETLESVKRDQV